MRVLTLTNLYPNPFQPNRATFNRQQLRELAVRSPVRVIAPILWTDELAARRQGLSPLPPGREVECDGIPVAHPRYWYPPKVLRSWYGRFFEWSVRAEFERSVREFRPDLVYTPWAYPDGWAAVHLARRAGLPVVQKVHGSDLLLLGQHPARKGGTAEALRGADAVVPVSRDLAQRVVGLGVEPERVRVVYCGVDTTTFSPGCSHEARARLGLDLRYPVLLFVGNLVPVKGLDTLIRACAALKQNGLRFTCHLLGGGPLRATLQRQILREGLDGCVRLEGPRPHHQLPDWYRAATAFVLPSRSEGVPHVLLEASACGTPWVASRVGGIPEIAPRGRSVLVPPQDPGRLAEALARCLGNPPPDAVMPRRSHADAAEEMAEVFREALNRFGKSRSADLPVAAPA